VQLSGISEDVPPIAGFSAQGSAIACTETAVQFSNTSLNSPETYSWTFESGNPATSTDYQPLITWTQPGLYDVELIVTKNGIADTLTIPDFIHVYDSPTLEILTESDSICPNSTITLTASGANLYYWLEGPSLNATNVTSVEFSPTATTLVSLSGVSAEGCFQTVSKTITILPQPGTPFITITGFSLQATNASSYIWYVNGLEINDSDTSNWMPLVNGNYNVRIYDEYGCTSISNPFNVNWVGIDEVVQNPLQMIPNPANEFVQLQSGNTIQSLQLYSVSGQLIESHNINAIQSILRTENLANGMYVVCVETAKGIQHLKLLVNH
jgi:PKD repeat protein